MRQKNITFQKPILIGITAIFTIWGLFMFNFKHQPSKEIQDRFNSTKLFNEYTGNNRLEISNVIIQGARIPASKANGFIIKNTEFIDFGGKESKWENGEFIDSELYDFSFYNAHLKNVVFKNAKINTAYFGKAKLENVKFINCEISNSSFFNLRDSSIEFIDSKIIDNDYKFSESHVQYRFINTEIVNTDFYSLKSGSSIYMEGSTNIESNYQRSTLDFFKSINSKIIDTSASNSEIGQFIIESSFIDLSFGDSIFNDVILENSKIPNMGAMDIKATNFMVSNCKDDAIISFSEATINNIEISNCKFTEFYPTKMTADSLSIENSTIKESLFYQSHIKKLTMTNVILTKDADFKDFTADKALFNNVTKGPKLELNLEGSNIKL